MLARGLILPLGFGILRCALRRRLDLFQGYDYPNWLLHLGVPALLILFLGSNSLSGRVALWQ